MKRTVLFPNVGRRVELINCFQRAAKESNINLKVIGTEITKDAPALSFCDASYILPKERNLKTLMRFIEIIETNSVDIVVCTIDPDVEFFSLYRESLAAVNLNKLELLLSDANIIDASSDKRKTAELFKKIGVNTPQLYDQASIKFPIFVKPAKGSGSFGAKLIFNAPELKSYLNEFGQHDPIFQEYISGKEYTLDCFIDFNGVVVVSPRERLKVRGGEVVVSRTVNLPELENQAKRLLSTGGFSGPVTLQAIIDEASGCPFFIEINARFGGGSILSIEAGLNSPYHILTRDPDWFSCLKRNLTMMRYDMSVFSEG